MPQSLWQCSAHNKCLANYAGFDFLKRICLTHSQAWFWLITYFPLICLVLLLHPHRLHMAIHTEPTCWDPSVPVFNLSFIFNLFPMYALKGKNSAPHSIHFMAYHYSVSEGRRVLVPVFKAISSVINGLETWLVCVCVGVLILPKDIQIFSLVSLVSKRLYLAITMFFCLLNQSGWHTLVSKMCIK